MLGRGSFLGWGILPGLLNLPKSGPLSSKAGAGGLGGQGQNLRGQVKKAIALKLQSCLRPVTWMGGPEGSLELEPGISSAGARAMPPKPHPQPGLTSPPSFPPSLPPSLYLLSLKVGGGTVRTSWLAGRGDFLGVGVLIGN